LPLEYLLREGGTGKREGLLGESHGVKVDDGVVELTCVGEGVPESSMGW
jgi:hypothetical protein